MKNGRNMIRDKIKIIILIYFFYKYILIMELIYIIGLSYILFIIILIIATVLTKGTVQNNLKITTGAFSFMLLLFICGLLQNSVGIGPIFIVFVIILGILIIVLLSLNIVNKEEFTNGVSRKDCKGEWTQNGECVSYDSEKVCNTNPNLKKRMPYPCITKDKKGNIYFSELNLYGLCKPVDSKYLAKEGGIDGPDGTGDCVGDEDDDNDDDVDGEDGGLYGMGAGGNSMLYSTFEENEQKKYLEKHYSQDQLDEMRVSGECIDSEEECVSGNISADQYCSSLGSGFGSTSKEKCCSSLKGNDIYKINCEYGYINGNKYSDGDLISMTQCIPMTSNFNIECQYANPPCAKYLNKCDCNNAIYGENKDQLCEWDNRSQQCKLTKGAPYKYRNYSSKDFGYQKILQGKEGNCYKEGKIKGSTFDIPDNNMGRAICSPNFFSGIRKIPKSTNCNDMNSPNFQKECENNYGDSYTNIDKSNSSGCMDNQTRKICNKNKN